MIFIFKIFFKLIFNNYNIIKKFNLFSFCPINRLILENDTIINNCLISTISTSVIGGSIYINGEYNLYINDTSFFQCINYNEKGGAIFFIGGLNFKIFRTCALFCSTNKYYQFAYIHTNNNNNSNFINYLSISKCSNNSIGFTSLLLYYGIQNLSNTNSSFNYNKEVSCIHIIEPNNFFSIYNTFYKNNAQNCICFYFIGNFGYIYNSNIISNHSPFLGNVYIGSGSYFLNECIFKDNNNSLFYINFGSLTLNNCIINQDLLTITTNTKTQPQFNPLLISNTNSYILNHYNTQFIYSNELKICIFNPTPSLIISSSSLERTYPPIPTICRTYPPIPTIERSYFSNSSFLNNSSNLNDSFLFFSSLSITSLIFIIIMIILIYNQKKISTSSSDYSSEII